MPSAAGLVARTQVAVAGSNRTAVQAPSTLHERRHSVCMMPVTLLNRSTAAPLLRLTLATCARVRHHTPMPFVICVCVELYIWRSHLWQADDNITNISAHAARVRCLIWSSRHGCAASYGHLLARDRGSTSACEARRTCWKAVSAAGPVVPGLSTQSTPATPLTRLRTRVVASAQVHAAQAAMEDDANGGAAPARRERGEESGARSLGGSDSDTRRSRDTA